LRVLEWSALLKWSLVGFFTIAGLVNLAEPAPMAADYLRWGYPDWFHYVTGILELLSAFLQARRATRTVGLVLGVSLMGAAVVTLTVHREWPHAMLPALICVALAIACASLGKAHASA
jgi:hypothetical protein